MLPPTHRPHFVSRSQVASFKDSVPEHPSTEASSSRTRHVTAGCRAVFHVILLVVERRFFSAPTHAGVAVLHCGVFIAFVIAVVYALSWRVVGGPSPYSARLHGPRRSKVYPTSKVPMIVAVFLHIALRDITFCPSCTGISRRTKAWNVVQVQQTTPILREEICICWCRSQQGFSCHSSRYYVYEGTDCSISDI